LLIIFEFWLFAYPKYILVERYKLLEQSLLQRIIFGDLIGHFNCLVHHFHNKFSVVSIFLPLYFQLMSHQKIELFVVVSINAEDIIFHFRRGTSGRRLRVFGNNILEDIL